MTDRPIIFSAPMVLALLDGRKTQTRRILNPQPFANVGGFAKVFAGPPYFEARDLIGNPHESAFPNGKHSVTPYPPIRIAIGDRLWVREAWCTTPAYDDLSPAEMGGEEPLRYRADGTTFNWTKWDGARCGRRRASMHMPRWASRLTLTVTDVRVERLQEISEADAEAEGCVWDAEKFGYWVPGVQHPNKSFPYLARATAREMYAALWDELHGSGQWLANPFVVALTFSVERRNIDEVAACNAADANPTIAHAPTSSAASTPIGGESLA